jgi:tetratricopeptide (TPR) repeat protein
MQDREAAWSRVLQLAPDSAAAWSNRGTLRLQRGRWADAEADLARAVELERQNPEGDGSGATLNNLGTSISAPASTACGGTAWLPLLVAVSSNAHHSMPCLLCNDCECGCICTQAMPRWHLVSSSRLKATTRRRLLIQASTTKP